MGKARADLPDPVGRPSKPPARKDRAAGESPKERDTDRPGDISTTTETAPAPAMTSATADELLSQLAGSEIDRLLAEVDGEHPRAGRSDSPDRDLAAAEFAALLDASTPKDRSSPATKAESGASTPVGSAPPAPPATAAAAPPPPAPTAAGARVRGEVSFKPRRPQEVSQPDVDAVVQGNHAPAGPAATSLDDSMAAQLDSVFDSLGESPAPVPTVPLDRPPSHGPVSPEIAAAAAALDAVPAKAENPPAEEDLEADLERAKRHDAGASDAGAILDESAADELADALDADEAVEAAEEDSAQPLDERLPLYLRPLEWLNAPLAMFPDPVREALGKVAILTLANALAVLLYVVLFRRR